VSVSCFLLLSSFAGRTERTAGLEYIKSRLEPIVNRGGTYSIVILPARNKRSSSTWDAYWLLSQYKTLPKPLRKNVQLLVWVNPTSLTKVAIALAKPFVSSKATKKIRTIKSVEELEKATGGKIKKDQLGDTFLSSIS